MRARQLIVLFYKENKKRSAKNQQACHTLYSDAPMRAAEGFAVRTLSLCRPEENSASQLRSPWPSCCPQAQPRLLAPRAGSSAGSSSGLDGSADMQGAASHALETIPKGR
eukprot:scaffold13187_cov30-Prasinocladus_malaysianus.AAC.1